MQTVGYSCHLKGDAVFYTLCTELNKYYRMTDTILSGRHRFTTSCLVRKDNKLIDWLI